MPLRYIKVTDKTGVGEIKPRRNYLVHFLSTKRYYVIANGWS